MAAVLTIQFRFWRSVYKPADEQGCWLWTGGKDVSGYGSIQWSAKRERRAHRVSYILNVGEIPEGMQVQHTCDIRACVNPAHLYLGTPIENVRDSFDRGTFARGETHSRTVLSEPTVIKIRQYRALGAKTRVLSQEFGTTQGNICNIVKGRSWKHLL